MYIYIDVTMMSLLHVLMHFQFEEMKESRDDADKVVAQYKEAMKELSNGREQSSLFSYNTVHISFRGF